VISNKALAGFYPTFYLQKKVLGRARLSVGRKEAPAMGLLRNIQGTSKGQSLVEYALVAAVVSAAIVIMSTYVFRSVQATQQTIQKEFSNQ
jgi:Flp pilus assembly pilin Flp